MFLLLKSSVRALSKRVKVEEVAAFFMENEHVHDGLNEGQESDYIWDKASTKHLPDLFFLKRYSIVAL